MEIYATTVYVIADEVLLSDHVYPLDSIPNLGAPRGVHSLADESSVRKPLIRRILYRVLSSGGDEMS